MADSFLIFFLVIRLRLKGVACQERIVLRNKARTVSLAGRGARFFWAGKRKRLGVRDEKIVWFGTTVGLGAVGSNPGADGGQLDGSQRISKSREVYGQHERKAGYMAAVQRRKICRQFGDVYRKQDDHHLLLLA